MSDVRLGVCGLGLIGSSLVRATGPQNAVVMDPSPSASDAMRALGATVVDSLSGFTSCDVIALAAPTAVNSALLAELMDVGPRVPTFDLGSVKEPILEVWRSDPSFPFVGTHPMAGSERSGAAAGDADLFRGSAWPVVVAPDTDAAALSAVVDVILSTGARVAFEDVSPDPVNDIPVADPVGVLEVLRSLTDTGSAIVGRTGDTVTVTVVQEG